MYRFISTSVFFIIFSTLTFAQLQSVKFDLVYDESTDLFDCFLHIEEGSTESLIHRIQFNSQISLVIPTGSDLNIEKLYLPLVNNQDYSSSTPMAWDISNRINSPQAQPENDFITIVPQLSPTALYNDISQGDVLKLFSLKITGEKVCPKSVRFHDITKDPNTNDSGMDGGDFRNGFTVGSLKQLYNGSIINEEVITYQQKEEIQVGECITLVANTECMSYPQSFSWSTGETSPTIEVCPSESKIYSVSITEGKGEQMVLNNTIEINDGAATTSVITKKEIKVDAHPNPVSETLQISSKKKFKKVNVYNSAGELIKSKDGASALDKIEIDMSSLNKGLYLVQVVNDNSSGITSIIKL